MKKIHFDTPAEAVNDGFVKDGVLTPSGRTELVKDLAMLESGKATSDFPMGDANLEKQIHGILGE